MSDIPEKIEKACRILERQSDDGNHPDIPSGLKAGELYCLAQDIRGAVAELQTGSNQKRLETKLAWSLITVNG